MLRPLTSSTQISPIEIDEVNSLLPSVRSIATPNGDGNVNGDNAWGPLLIDASASKNKNGDPRASISLSAHEHNEINYTNGGLTLPVVDHSIATRPIEASEPSGDGASFEMKPAVNDDKQRMKTSATATSSYERDASAHLSGDQRAGPDTMGQVRTESNWQEASSGLKREAELETGGAFPKRCCSQESLELATVVDAQVFIKRASAQPLMTSDQIGDVSAEINSLKMPADHSISPRLSEASKASRDGFSFEEKPPVVDDDQQRIKTSATATPSYERGSSAHRSGDERAASDTMGQVGTDSNGQEVSTGLKREAEPEKGGAYPNRCWSQEPLKLKSVADVQVFIERAAQPLKTSDEMGDITAEINSLAKINNEDDVIEIERFMLNHGSSYKLAWDCVMMVFILWSSIATPISIGFALEVKGIVLAVDTLMEIVFLLDVGLNFRTTMVDPSTKDPITEPREICKRYLKGWLFFDLLSSLPVMVITAILHVENNSVDPYFMALKLLRTMKLHQLSVITTSFLKRFEDRDFNPTMFRMYMFVLWFLLVLHFIACSYWGISRTTDPEFDGEWTPEEYYLELGVHQQYARALYFALAIIYGNDLSPDNEVEYAFSNLCLLLSLVTNAVIIGSATNLLSNMDAGAVAKKAQLDSINGYMHFRKVPQRLQKKIRSFYEYMWDSGQDNHSTRLFEEMPEKLKLQLNVALKRRLIEKVPLFKTCSPVGIIALVQNLASNIILPGELIVRQGEPATSMFFISRGSVDVFVAAELEEGQLECQREERYVISLSDGSFFGEVALLKENHLRTANIRAETFVELQVLHARDFRALLQTFPEFQTAVTAVSRSRLKVSDALTRLKTRGQFSTTLRSGKPGAIEKQAARSDKLASLVVRLVAKAKTNKTLPETTSLQRGGTASFASPRSAIFDDGTEVSRPQGVYDRIEAQEDSISHEAILRVARGGGIQRETLR